jgi:nucleoid DNA-binding protein
MSKGELVAKLAEGEEVQIAATKVPTFKANKALKDAVKG